MGVLNEEVDTRKIFELRQEINKLLRGRPELRPLQEEIEERINKAGSPENRAVMAYILMVEKVKQLNAELKTLLPEPQHK